MLIEKKVAELGWKIPPVYRFKSPAIVPFVRVGNLLFLAGMVGTDEEGKLKYVGKVDKECSVEDGYQSARLSILNHLASIKAAVGDLDKVERVIKLVGYVNSSPGFRDQSKVVNGASDALIAIFGDKGKHVRASYGIYELSMNAPLETEILVQVKD